jgi:DNA-binding NarL/FixJ family response regulator
MKAIIIDDSEYKITHVEEILSEFSQFDSILEAKSFQTGRNMLISENPELAILDMSIPTSERTDGALEGRMRIFGGKELIYEIQHYGLQTKAIIVSQFDQFGTTPNIIKFDALMMELKISFPDLFIGGLYYSNVDSSWRARLKKIVKKFLS